jgi:hypothetical protein
VRTYKGRNPTHGPHVRRLGTEQEAKKPYRLLGATLDGRRPHVDSGTANFRRRGSDGRPDRLRDSSARHSNPSLSMQVNPARDRSVWLRALGLKDQCDALATPVPRHIAALVEQLGTHIQQRHWLDYDPVAVAVLVIGIGLIELVAMII